MAAEAVSVIKEVRREASGGGDRRRQPHPSLQPTLMPPEGAEFLEVIGKRRLPQRHVSVQLAKAAVELFEQGVHASWKKETEEQRFRFLRKSIRREFANV